MDDVDLELDTGTFGDNRRMFDADGLKDKYECSISIDIETEQTVVCRHCGEVTPVPGGWVCRLFKDAPCVWCGFPTGMVRE